MRLAVDHDAHVLGQKVERPLRKRVGETIPLESRREGLDTMDDRIHACVGGDVARQAQRQLCV
eukprot:CAMPEP_0204017808 /NCGR_PEP_ID=MMETSP0360-20130528/27652_1 /ASSEMBLY_ACC=CAM_ASM_000342 /TAXON_ID=268821 /ORGANISM="Scrippsiella Hangoei, Strain SHTV-5" /LENGTH=62 /DNA_ID=CAMNT_0050960889 /DNA_START=14 /DNA_END=202 /DNA_ORIENTATION=+